MQYNKIKFANKNNYIQDILLVFFKNKFKLIKIKRQLHNLQIKKLIIKYIIKFQVLALKT